MNTKAGESLLRKKKKLVKQSIMEKEVKQLPKTAKLIRRDWEKSVYESKKGVYYVYEDCIKRIY